MIKLNPCPACGNEPGLYIGAGPIYTVVCRCGLAVDADTTNGDSAINAWNDITANFNSDPVKTLRDEFAMAYITGAAAAKTWITPDSLAVNAYEAADAMIKERNK